MGKVKAKAEMHNRRTVAFAIVVAVAVGLLARTGYLQLIGNDKLQQEAAKRQVRHVSVPAYRGMLLDRHGEPLAISTPMPSVYVNPQQFIQYPDKWPVLAKALGINQSDLEERLQSSQHLKFIYLRRLVQPQTAREVRALKKYGVGLERAFRRYYPAADVSAQLVGFTNISDRGQEGIELALDEQLAGVPGERRLLINLHQQGVEAIGGEVKPVKPGRDVQLSIDIRLQYLVYRELQDAVEKYQARAGSAVVMNVHTGEVVALVNQPSFNPNDVSERFGESPRNRVVTDVLEPGSTMKIFLMAAALESGQYRLSDKIPTAPGHLRIGKYTIKDHRNYGTLDLSRVIQKSSNVGVTRIALGLDPVQQWEVLDRFGFGHLTGSEFPGEVEGKLTHGSEWGRIQQATVTFGYGVSVTTLQLARAYAAIASGGTLPDVTFLKQKKQRSGTRIINEQTARVLQMMLETVIRPEGTGYRARVSGYRVAGKTGTSRKSIAGGYSEDRYYALFAGFAPASRPEYVAVVAIDEPIGETVSGGSVAAPVFSQIMAGTLRLMGSVPDKLKTAGVNRSKGAGS